MNNCKQLLYFASAGMYDKKQQHPQQGNITPGIFFLNLGLRRICQKLLTLSCTSGFLWRCSVGNENWKFSIYFSLTQICETHFVSRSCSELRTLIIFSKMWAGKKYVESLEVKRRYWASSYLTGLLLFVVGEQGFDKVVIRLNCITLFRVRT